MLRNLKFECPVDECEQVFNKRLELRKHLLYSHDKIKSLYECFVCHQKFAKSTDISLHEKFYHGEYTCSVCDQKFTENSYLKAHMKKHEVERDKFKCKFCNKEFLYKAI